MGCGACSSRSVVKSTQSPQPQKHVILDTATSTIPTDDGFITELPGRLSTVSRPSQRSRCSQRTMTTRSIFSQSLNNRLFELRTGGPDPHVEGIRHLRKAYDIIVKGRPKGASAPERALSVFLRDEAGQYIPESMQESMLVRMKTLTEQKKMPAKLGSQELREEWSGSGRWSGHEDISRDNSSGEHSKLTREAEQEAMVWSAFARWCMEQLQRELFGHIASEADGYISAQELMTMLVLVSVAKGADFKLEPKDAELTLQEFDLHNIGHLSVDAFLDMVHQLEKEFLRYDNGVNADPGAIVAPAKPMHPHLILNFDVNNTVMILDSNTGCGARDLIVSTLAGCAWGITACHGKRWVMVSPEPSTAPPWQGLISFAEFVEQTNPIPAKANMAEIKSIKKKRKEYLKSFCDTGQPGESLGDYLDSLLRNLSLLEEVNDGESTCDPNESEPEVPEGPAVRLLPSFYYMMSELKKAKRSFSLVFRTFGTDLNSKFEREFNAFCEGRHPLFLDGPILDGSDGENDHRMDLANKDLMGTLVRGLGDENIALVWGTHEQPEPHEGGIDFYRNLMENDPDKELEIVEGVKEVAASLEKRVLEFSGTIALRDFYDAWAAVNFRSVGGKPLFLNIEDREIFQVFCDDHIRPTDPTIVDPMDPREYPKRVPMAQVFHAHLIKASPLHSIEQRSYFWDELVRCEQTKIAQSERRRKVGEILHNVEGIRSTIKLLKGDEPDMRTLSVLALPTEGDMDHTPSSRAGLHFTPFTETPAICHFPPLDPDAMEKPENTSMALSAKDFGGASSMASEHTRSEKVRRRWSASGPPVRLARTLV